MTNSDGWAGYDGLVDVGYKKHFRVNHGDDEFAREDYQINGIESFRGFAKSRLIKFNGVRPELFYLHLKECEFRFNQRHDDLYAILLKELRIRPLS